MAQVTWTRAALVSVEEIRADIADHNPVAAARIAGELISAGDSLAALPFRGVWVGGDRRKLILPPYVILYRVTPDGAHVTIARVRDGRRIA